MATEKVLKGKIQIIIDDLTELNTLKSSMESAAGYGNYDDETEVMQYVDGMYNVTYAFYDTENTDIPT